MTLEANRQAGLKAGALALMVIEAATRVWPSPVDKMGRPQPEVWGKADPAHIKAGFNVAFGEPMPSSAKVRIDMGNAEIYIYAGWRIVRIDRRNHRARIYTRNAAECSTDEDMFGAALAGRLCRLVGIDFGDLLG